jgi:2-oxoglutarate dehydrogenase E1 component
VFCSGRIYYDLARVIREKELGQIALIRVEQLYPVPDIELNTVIQRYPDVQDMLWAQDEPRNQGAWRFMAHHLRRLSSLPLVYAGRTESSAPATGIASQHKVQLEAIINRALSIS